MKAVVSAMTKYIGGPLALAVTRCSSNRSFWLVASCIFIVTMIGASWVGFIESDDLAYANAADGWLLHAPFLGGTHWALRHFIVMPLAVSFAIFGHGEMALALPMLFYGIGLLLLMGLCVGHVAGPVAGVLTPVLIASVPTFALGATLGATDVPEAFLIMASFWAFHFASQSSRRWLFVASGVLAGCGLLTRETTVALLVPYAILFAVGYGKRGNYLWMGAGFMAVVGIDLIYLYVLSGDPLWRIHVTQRGVSNDSPYNPLFSAPAGAADPFGLYALPRALQAVLLLFASPAVGFFAWFGIPAAVRLAWAPPSGGAGKIARLFTLLAVAWFLMLNFVFLVLWVIPRYQLVTLCALAVPASILLAGWLERGMRWRVAAVLAPLLASGLLLSIASDHGLLFGERALVSFTHQTNEPIRTDPATLEGAQWLLQVAGADGRVTAAAPVAGGLYFVNHTPRRHLPADWVARDIPTGSTVVAGYVQPSGLISTAAAAIGLDRIMPEVVWRKIQPQPRRAEAMRVP